jgi:hypothetical protein
MTISDEVAIARKRIFRDGYDISFGELASLYSRQELIVQPEYQRLFRWDQTQKNRFIESLILNIPIPPIFVFSDDRGRWELVDGLQRVSTVLEFMGVLRDEEGKLKEAFRCDGTVLLPSLEGIRWPMIDEKEDSGEYSDPTVLPINLQATVRRARIRVEILGQETETHVKYELFKRLNSGGANLSEQELRNCIVVAVNRAAFNEIREMSQEADFVALANVGEERIKRQFLAELVTRFVVLRNCKYQKKLDVHEFLDKGMLEICENESFDWKNERLQFSETMRVLMRDVGPLAFLKNNRFSLGMFEFIVLGLSKAIEKASSELSRDFVYSKVMEVPELPNAKKYSGIGVRGTQRLASFVIPDAVKFFAQKKK